MSQPGCRPFTESASVWRPHGSLRDDGLSIHEGLARRSKHVIADAAPRGSAYCPLEPGVRLDTVICFRHSRRVPEKRQDANVQVAHTPVADGAGEGLNGHLVVHYQGGDHPEPRGSHPVQACCEARQLVLTRHTRTWWSQRSGLVPGDGPSSTRRRDDRRSGGRSRSGSGGPVCRRPEPIITGRGDRVEECSTMICRRRDARA